MNNLIVKKNNKIVVRIYLCILILSSSLMFSTNSVMADVVVPTQWSRFSHIADISVEGNIFRGRIVGVDPYMEAILSNPVDAEQVVEIIFQLRITTGKKAQFFWATHDAPNFSSSRCTYFPLKSDGQWHTYKIATGGLKNWSGILTRIRLDPAVSPKSLSYFSVKSTEIVTRTTVNKKTKSPRTITAHLNLKVATKSQNQPQTARQKALFTKSGAIRIGESKVFPLGLGDIPAVNQPFAQVQKSGFNCLVFGGFNKELLDILDKHNLKMVLSLSALYAQGLPKQLRAKRARKLLSNLLKHKDVVLAYMGEDEPQWLNFPLKVMQYAYTKIQSLTPNRAVFVNQAPRGTISQLRKYSKTADITGCDIYPVPKGNGHSNLPNQAISVVGDYVDKMQESALPNQPVWMYLQAYGRGPHNQLPTWHQTRFMAYNAIMHGAKGLIYYGLRHLPWPNKMWPQLQRLGPELRGLEDVLVSPWAGRINPVLAKKGIDFRFKKIGNQYYLFVANTTKNPIMLKWTMSISPDNLYVLFENRSLQAKDNLWKDSFAPYQVHVYATAPRRPFHAKMIDSSGGYNVLQQSDAKWIWMGGYQKKPHQMIYFRRLVQTSNQLQSTPIIVTADDAYQFYVNGQLVGKKNGVWYIAEKYNITPYLIPNSLNILAAKVRNGRSWAGLFIQGRVGTKSINSNEQWSASASAQNGWNNLATYNTSGWSQAKSFGQIGKNNPWNRLFVPSKVK